MNKTSSMQNCSRHISFFLLYFNCFYITFNFIKYIKYTKSLCNSKALVYIFFSFLPILFCCVFSFSVILFLLAIFFSFQQISKKKRLYSNSKCKLNWNLKIVRADRDCESVLVCVYLHVALFSEKELYVTKWSNVWI